MHQAANHLAFPARTTRPARLVKALCLGSLLVGASWTFAAPPETAAPAAPAAVVAPATTESIQSRYERERDNCLKGKTNQDQPTCLREAGAARDEARKGLLTGADAAALQQNAVDRCKTVPADEQAACRDRITKQGNTTTTGSVQSGGILREHVEVVPAPVKPAETQPTK